MIAKHTVSQVVSHLHAEYGLSVDACAVSAYNAMANNLLNCVQILLLVITEKKNGKRYLLSLVIGNVHYLLNTHTTNV